MLALLCAAAVSGCGDETAIIIETEFHDNLDPHALGRLLLIVEPADGTGFDGIDTGIDDVSDGIGVRVVDVDQDGFPEMVFTIPESAVSFRTGGRLRLKAGSLPIGEPIRIIGLAADFGVRGFVQQIGGGSVDEEKGTDGKPLAFREGEEVLAELELACFCNGGRGCRAGNTFVCVEAPTTEAYCNDRLNNDTGDEIVDCGDSDCWGERGPCEGCHVEVCDNENTDDSCDGLADCSDPLCVGSAACLGTSPEICVGGEDEDGDGSIDCFDPDCAHVPGCRNCSTLDPEDCGNLADDDCDGLIDCHDPDCPEDQWPEVEEDCEDGFDNDCNGVADCSDAACLVAAHCECPVGEVEICMDRFDTDCDGKTDCEDPDCESFRVPEGRDNPRTCDDGIDNDCNGLVDCQELSSQCVGALPEVCGDGRDNDCDGTIDCDDDDCTTVGIVENCFDFIDNDCDGLVDCYDEGDCSGGGENCWNFRDDDCDGAWDCSDDECAEAAVCEGLIPERCANGSDDDGDGWIDCNDEDCFGKVGCVEF